MVHPGTDANVDAVRPQEARRFEMVSRVARALFLSQHPQSEWSAGRARAKWFIMAEEAIAAMREPTDPMIEAGWNASGEAHDRYRAMIDAALAY